MGKLADQMLSNPSQQPDSSGQTSSDEDLEEEMNLLEMDGRVTMMLLSFLPLKRKYKLFLSFDFHVNTPVYESINHYNT